MQKFNKKRVILSLLTTAVCFFIFLQSAAGQPEKRIISSCPSATEIIFALGLGKDLVGVSAFCRFPPEAKTKANIGGNFDPNFESIAALNPTDAVILKTDAKLRGFFKKTGVPWLETRFDNLSDTYESILLIGSHFGATKKAKALVSNIKAGLAKITAKKKNLRKKRVLLVISRDVDRLQNIWVAGGKSFLGEILRICGGENIFEDLGPAYAQIGQEEILVRDPEVIIEVMAAEKAPDQNRVLVLWSRLGTVRAIKDGKIFIINDRFMTIPGPRIPEIAKVFMDCL
ncbi:MAG: ABC transporter substrate-binding protein [Deltaproteobacteria bacterium]|nr:ABC transporter substrate-binding protein [Deltaproteobacteria bacterium]